MRLQQSNLAVLFRFDFLFCPSSCRYTARLSYAQTVAVMSIVGFILGLGDRHGENILFDVTCGDAVHVDFNCLFNKARCTSHSTGLTSLASPVPFVTSTVCH